MLPTTVIILFAILFPAIIIFVREQGGIFKKLNPLITCYIAGIIIANFGLLSPESIPAIDMTATIAVALSIPLMLFSVNLRDWKNLTGKAGISMILASIAVVIISASAHLLFGDKISESWKVSGLLVGVYTGGTPNLAAIKAALDVEMGTYLAVHTSDIILSAIYIFFVLTIAKKFLSRFLPVVESKDEKIWNADSEVTSGTYKHIFKREIFLPLFAAFGLAVFIFALGAGLSFIVPEGISTMIVILTITTLSLIASLIPRIRNIKMTFQAGEYIILIFCFVVGALGDFSNLMGSAPYIFMFVAFVITGTLILHIILCRIFKIDVDTMLVTSTAAICSPPFVGVVAISIKKRELIVPGITTGILGYAIGNYLGILTAQIIKVAFP